MRYLDSLKRARSELFLANQFLQDELAAYPTPIAGCDEQYTHLLAERLRIRNALAALEAQEFLATPRRLDAQARMESR